MSVSQVGGGNEGATSREVRLKGIRILHKSATADPDAPPIICTEVTGWYVPQTDGSLKWKSAAKFSGCTHDVLQAIWFYEVLLLWLRGGRRV